MPLVRLQTSAALGPEQKAKLMQELSSTTARVLGKPESAVMVVLELGTPMLFAGAPEPAAFLEVRSAGEIAPELAVQVSRALSEVVRASLAIEPERIFLNLTGVPRSLWGFRGTTLAAR